MNYLKPFVIGSSYVVFAHLFTKVDLCRLRIICSAATFGCTKI